MAQNLKDRREQRAHEKKQKKRDHKFFKKLAAIGVFTMVGKGHKSKESFKEIIDLITPKKSRHQPKKSNSPLKKRKSTTSVAMTVVTTTFNILKKSD